MKSETPKPIHLKDYRSPSHRIPWVELRFELDDNNTRVTSKMQVERNSTLRNSSDALVLQGEEMELLSVKIDGRQLPPGKYSVTEHTLTLEGLPDQCTLEIENSIDPAANKALEGLYKSGNLFCTQCEPEGFRRITYFLDRSDVMARFTTTLVADKAKYPTLLSNGNPIDQGDLDNGRHWVTWEDPFPKPSYLFALVAGDLGVITDTFRTASDREIDLRIYCDAGNEGRCQHAMRSLKKSMRWDEEVFGLEYDLDIFMIVAVDAFNMGAMENKGLNIFNASCVLADDATATDDNYARVEGVIAHEYFHNWTGNRVTCRDWFQLTLKEGLTVFRDQEFSSDMNSRPVKRVEDVLTLRSAQFAEDAGPTAHPIQPQSYIQINNFYTTTVYNKGAEVIRMIHRLIGPEAFRKGIDKYFELFDGQAVTTEDFLHAMEIASGRDLLQFRRWYRQAGTPEVHLDFAYDDSARTFTLTAEQTCPPTADGSPKEPWLIPLEIGLLDSEGNDMPLSRKPIVEVALEKQTFTFDNVKEAPTVSINRQFTAPVKVHAPYSRKELTFLMAHDNDPFNRWNAGQELACEILLDMLEQHQAGEAPQVDAGYLDAYGTVLNDNALDRALKALALVPPSEETLGQRQDIIDIDGTHSVREQLITALARYHREALWETYRSLHNPKESYCFDPVAVGRRSLKNACLSILGRLDDTEVHDTCYAQFTQATNMTDRFAALAVLASSSSPKREEVLKTFYNDWNNDLLVITKWFGAQALSRRDDTTHVVQELAKDPVFDLTLPNLARALYGSFVANNKHFHAKDGSGYKLLADQVLTLDKLNPLMAARLCGGFKKLHKLDSARQKILRQELDRILTTEDLSTHVYEICSKCVEMQDAKQKQQAGV